MSEPVAILLGLVSLAVVSAILYRTFGRSPAGPDARDEYRRALELWIEGDLAEAALLLRRVVASRPQDFEPFLYLGILLRLEGDAARAASLHRGLTVRRDLTHDQKVTVGLALAEDLLALKNWADAGRVLDGLGHAAETNRRFWFARFVQHVGQGNLPDAARALKHAPKHCPPKDAAWLRDAYAAFQLDRALRHALAGEGGDARARLRDVERIESAAGRSALVRAILAGREGDAATAVTEAAENLLDLPFELGICLPLLQEALLRSGQFARSIPILERACQEDGSPPSMWIDLAMLYEKLDQRGRALELLESKSGQPGLTPDVAAPFLRMIVRDEPHADFSRVWNLLEMPRSKRTWACCDCGHEDAHIRWYCPACHAFDSYRPGCRRRKES